MSGRGSPMFAQPSDEPPALVAPPVDTYRVATGQMETLDEPGFGLFPIAHPSSNDSDSDATTRRTGELARREALARSMADTVQSHISFNTRHRAARSTGPYVPRRARTVDAGYIPPPPHLQAPPPSPPAQSRTPMTSMTFRPRHQPPIAAHRTPSPTPAPRPHHQSEQQLVSPSPAPTVTPRLYSWSARNPMGRNQPMSPTPIPRQLGHQSPLTNPSARMSLPHLSPAPVRVRMG